MSGASAWDPRGLCPGCKHVHIIRNDRGSTFLRCTLSKDDPSWSKYPPQPVIRCRGFEAAKGETPPKEDS